MRFALCRNSPARIARAAGEIASALLLAAVLGVTLAQVAARYLFGWPMPWSEELTRLLFVWMVMLAAGKGGHMRIDFFATLLPQALQQALAVLVALLSIGLLALMAYKSLDLIELTRYDRYVALGVSVQLLYWAAFTGCVLWIVGIAAEACGMLCGRS